MRDQEKSKLSNKMTKLKVQISLNVIKNTARKQ